MSNESNHKPELSDQARRVTQEGATEPPFSGHLLNNKADGMYHCVVCGEPLFSSDTKYDSGSGWPSFYAAAEEEKIRLIEDNSLGMKRTEVRCGNCDAHLGHVFPDGPEKLPDGRDGTGQRFCINSCALSFSEDNKER